MNPYELSSDELLRKFMDACGRAGFSNSGLVISFSAGSDLEYAHSLRAAVLARMEHAEPPLKPGTKVRPKNDATQPSPSNEWRLQGGTRQLPNLLTVKTIHYVGGGKWDYKFAEVIGEVTAGGVEMDDGDKTWTELRSLRFMAEDFQIIETEPAAAAS